VNWLGWLIAGLVLLLCVGTILAGLNTILVRGTTKSLKMNNVEIVGLVALILGSLLMCSALVMFAVWAQVRRSRHSGRVLRAPQLILGVVLRQRALWNRNLGDHLFDAVQLGWVNL
jgi:hypothetical protein